MGTAWKDTTDYPWETTRYVGGIEVVKINIALRIYSNKWHVYAGLAILNPSAREQIGTYADSATKIFKLMIEEKKEELRERMYAAREGVFGWTKKDGETLIASSSETQSGQNGSQTVEAIPADGQEHAPKRSHARRKPILLSDRILDQFSLGSKPEPGEEARPNSHLSLLAMVDCWHRLGIKPYDHLDVAGTPVFMLWIGTFVFLCKSPNSANGLYRCCRVPLPVA
jgi:prephenate dehydrogenase (NADP+)